MKPRISIIAPVRARVDLVDFMLATLRDTAAEPSRVEVVLRADNDDPAMINLLRQGPDTFIVGPRRMGYTTLASLINEAARLSHADLIMVVNDDAEFLTPGWDLKLEAAASQFPDGIFDLGVDTVMNNGNFVFPCMSRRTMETLDCFFDERLVYTDIWLRDVMEPFGRAVHVPGVTVRHNWTGMTEDQRQSLKVVHGHGYEQMYAHCVEEGREKVRQVLFQTESQYG